MEQKGNPVFQFRNGVSPRYIEPMFIRLQYDRWYSTNQLVDLLHINGLDVEGTDIASHNAHTWSLVGLGRLTKHRIGNKSTNMFHITDLGKQLIDTYSTNPDLFYDLMHFLFYSSYCRSGDLKRGCFWLYASICNTLWLEAPAQVDNSSLTNRLQIESREAFPGYDPSFSERSVRGIFPWLQTLVPPFLSKPGTKSQLYSKRRSYCTPQLFHLATDMVYMSMEGVQYGTALSVNEQQKEDICKLCLLDPEKFWEMADLTQMTISGYEIHQGQWGVSITLEGPPTWIKLPDFSDEKVEVDADEFDDGGGV